jgi:predicted acylesterase/phospholipase RssA
MIPRPFGLALSGGGFRATAFHLGVLKRLRELGLLEQIDFLSTVSGGSLAGATWVFWQSRRGDTINDPDEWARFETALIQLMRAGLRESLVRRGLFLPFLLLITISGLAGIAGPWLVEAGQRSGSTIRLAVVGVLSVVLSLVVGRGFLTPFLLIVSAALISGLVALGPGSLGDAPVMAVALSGSLSYLLLFLIRRGRFRPRPLILICSPAVGQLAVTAVGFTHNGVQAAAVVGSGLLAIAALAYVHWHYSAAGAMARQLGKRIYGNTTIHDLSKPEVDRAGRRNWPFLIVNATGLNAGDHLLFTPSPSESHEQNLLFAALSDKAGPRDLTRRWRDEPAYRDTPPRVQMPKDTRLSSVVTASCAIPSVFTPLSVSDTLPWFEWPDGWHGRFLAVDGGVADNQGIQMLLDGNCRGIVVSDAATPLKALTAPSSWQFLPPGKGVVFRSQDIVYERMRDLGYRRLEERHELYRLLQQTGGIEAAEEWGTPLLEGYGYIELWPSDGFRWHGGEHFARPWFSPLSSVRTDLNRFSAVEISTLMFHGYTTIDHCLRANHPDWIATEAPLNFSSVVRDIDIKWGELPTEESVRHAVHLWGSKYRSWWKRSASRLWNRGVVKRA